MKVIELVKCFFFKKQNKQKEETDSYITNTDDNYSLNEYISENEIIEEYLNQNEIIEEYLNQNEIIEEYLNHYEIDETHEINEMDEINESNESNESNLHESLEEYMNDFIKRKYQREDNYSLYSYSMNSQDTIIDYTIVNEIFDLYEVTTK
jgi:hypothetical protein